MTRERVYLFDTTLRDGAQTQGVDFSVEDKRTIALALDELGIDYVEGGWPGANPTDTAPDPSSVSVRTRLPTPNELWKSRFSSGPATLISAAIVCAS